ncbi:MAG: ABC transporter substrate-binding protein [Alphaproteobacteria bacterium]|nr:ABC transporter substrate-binding protein [Alphaproteobacteria bacterium]
MSDQSNDARLDVLARQALSGKLDRRRFMEGAMATGLTAAAASTLWSKKVAAETPKKGGTYRVGVHDGNTTDRLDPATTEGTMMIQMNHAIRSYLTEITNTDQLGPDAAASWEASNGAKTWNFKLHEGMTFHNGKEFTSADAVASLNYHRGEESTSPGKAMLSDVAEIKEDGKYSFTIEMQSGNADLPYTLSAYQFVMMPSDGEGNVDWQSGAGTGPYKIENFDAGVRAELVKHDGFHKEGRGHFDAVEMVVLNDVNARQTAVTTGDVDAITEFDLKTANLMKRNRNIEILEVASGAHVTMPMHVDTAPFDNYDVRKAMKLAIDRQDIINKILNGFGTIGNDHPIGPTVPYWSDIPQTPYDPDQAAFHLKKAGAEGLSVDLSASEAAFSSAVDMATLYKEHAAKAGININVVREPSDGYWSNVWLKKPFVVVQWGARPTPDVMFSLAYKDDAAWNEARWKNPRFNQLLLEAKAELDDAKRQALYTEMYTLCNDDGGTIVPFFRSRVGALRTNVGHDARTAGNWELDGARSYERWWFKDA